MKLWGLKRQFALTPISVKQIPIMSFFLKEKKGRREKDGRKEFVTNFL